MVAVILGSVVGIVACIPVYINILILKNVVGNGVL